MNVIIPINLVEKIAIFIKKLIKFLLWIDMCAEYYNPQCYSKFHDHKCSRVYVESDTLAIIE